MRSLIIKILANAIAFYCASLIFPGIQLTSPETAVWAGIILGLANLVIRPFILLLTLPVNLITIGLFTIVINTWMVLITDTLLEGLKIPNFWIAVATSLLISGFNIILQSLFKETLIN